MAVIGRTDFQGIVHFRPTVSGLFTSPTVDVPNDDLNTLILIGKADNGVYFNNTSLSKSERQYSVASYADAKRILKSGELLDACRIAFNPSTDTRFSKGAKRIILVNINQNTAASVVLPSTKAGNNHTISYPIAGPYGNRVRIKKESNRIYIVTPDGTMTSPAIDNTVLDLQYTGDATTAKLTISSTGLYVTLAGDQTDDSENLSISFSELAGVSDVIDFINIQTGYVANLIGESDFAMKNLDHIEATENIDIKTVKQIKGDLYYESEWMRSTGTGTISYGAVRKPIADNGAFVFYTGGTTGSAGSMQTAIDFTKNTTGLYRCILSNNVADQVYLKNAVLDMISRGVETIGGCGAGANGDETFYERVQQCRRLGAYPIVYGFHGVKALNDTGVEVEYKGYMLAVIACSIAAANNPRFSPTWKPLTITNTTESFTDREYEDIIKAGGLACSRKNENSPYKIERAVTTESSPNPIKSEMVSVGVALAMVKELREGFEQGFVGESTVDKRARVAGVTEQDVVSYVGAKLETFVENGYLVGSKALGIPAYNNDFKIKVDGDAWYIVMDGVQTTPINFIFFQLNLNQLSGTIQ